MEWCSKLAYLADVVKHLNDLNTKIQGKVVNFLTSSGKLRGFRSKLALWRSFVEQVQLDMFPLCNAHSNSKLPGFITQHLKVLEERFNFFFSAETSAEFDWVLDPWSSSGLESSKGMPLQAQVQLADLREDSSLKMKFQDMASQL